MENFLHRFRHLTALVAAILVQLVILAYQVKSDQDIRLIRVWAVTAVAPLAKVIETVRSTTSSFFGDYFVLLDVREQNRRMKADLDRIKLENQYLKSELSTADRARALAAFQTRSPSRTIAARVIGNGGGVSSKISIIDRGSNAGIALGMAVITPDGIAGKIIRVFLNFSYVLLVTDPTFAAGVISQNHRVHGTLKGQGHSTCMVEYVQNEQPVDQGEWFYTSGDDRIFPKGIPVGQVTVVREGKGVKEIFLVPASVQLGLEEVLVVLEGVHTTIPDAAPSNAPRQTLLPPPPDENPATPVSGAPNPSGTPVASPATANGSAASAGTEADRMVERYRRIGDAQGHKYGEGIGRVPDFNLNPDAAAAKDAAKSAAPKPDGVKADPVKTNPAKTDPSKPAVPKPDVPRPDATKPDGVKPAGAAKSEPQAIKPAPRQ